MAINFDDMKAAILELRAALLGSAAEKGHSRQAVMQLRLERLLFITNDYEFSRDLLFEIARYEREFRIDLSNSLIAICQMLHSGKLDVDLLKQVDPILKQGFKNINPIYILSDDLLCFNQVDILRYAGADMCVAITKSVSNIISKRLHSPLLLFVLNGDLRINLITSPSGFTGFSGISHDIVSLSDDLRHFFRVMVFKEELNHLRQIRIDRLFSNSNQADIFMNTSVYPD